MGNKRNTFLKELLLNKIHWHAIDVTTVWTILKVMVLIGFTYCVYSRSLGPAISLGFFITLMFGIEAEALYEALIARKLR